MYSLFNRFLKQNRHKLADHRRFSPIGLDIGSAMIKLVQLEQRNGHTRLYAHAALPAPPNRSRNGIVELSDLSETLCALLKQSGAHSNRTYLSLHSQAMTLRRVTLPPLSPSEVARAMRWEAVKQLTLPLEESVFDYAFLEKRISQGKTVLEFALAAAPKAQVKSYVEAASQAGFYPEAIETAPFALRRAVHWCGGFQPSPHRNTVLIIHTGAESSDLLVLHQGHFRFYRPVNLGVNHFRREAALSRRKQGETEQLLRPPDSLSGRGQAGAALKLARQAARTMEFYALETDYPEKKCSAVLLCGGGALISGLDSYLAAELDLETSRFDPLPVDSGAGAGIEDESGPLYSAALGLALRGWIR